MAIFSTIELLGQVFQEEIQPILTKDIVDVLIVVTSCRQNGCEFLQIEVGIEVAGRFFATEAAIEVGAKGDMSGIAGDTADVINVVGKPVEGYLLVGTLFKPDRVDHAGVKGDANDSAANNEPFDLII
jgi:hypothetical protein